MIFALELFSYALANAFLQPFWKMRDLVFGGEMDFYLVRPVNTLYYIMTKGFAPGYTAHIVLSTIVLVTASVQLGRFTSPGFWLLVFLTIFVGAGIQFGLRCIPAFLTFWLATWIICIGWSDDFGRSSVTRSTFTRSSFRRSARFCCRTPSSITFRACFCLRRSG